MKYGIYIGHSPKTIQKLDNLIMKILYSSCSDAVKITAIQEVSKVSQISNVSISNCEIGDVPQPLPSGEPEGDF